MIIKSLGKKIFPALVTSLALTACKKSADVSVTEAAVVDPLKAADMPVLDPAKDAEWTYRVTVRAPQELVDGKQREAVFERKRRYLGEVDPGGGHEKTNCFEVWARGTKRQREYVKITPEGVFLSGQTEVDEQGTESRPIWFQEPILFFRAGLIAGDTLPMVILNKDKKLWRATRVIAREKVVVPAGEFNAVRLQMIGRDGNFTSRRTYWFAPGTGIVKEEKEREFDGRTVFLETDELASVTGLK